MNMNMMVDDNLDYPNLTTCQLKLIGLAANDASRPPIKLPVEIREDYMRYSNNSNSNNNNDFDDFSLERAVLRRKEERDIDSQLMGGATSKEELEKATIIKMKNVTGEKDDSVCIALLKDNGYNMKESIEAYLEI